MLTVGKRRTEKGACALALEDVLGAAEGMLAVVVPRETLPDGRVSEDGGEGEAFLAAVRRVKEAFGEDGVSLAARCSYDGQDEARLEQLAEMAREVGIPLVATNDVHYHAAERRPLQDALTCIRLGCTVREAGFALFANAERHIKGPAEMARLFRKHPEAIARTMEIARRAAAFSLKELKYEYPAEICPPGKTMMEHLREKTWEGARERYREEGTRKQGIKESREAHGPASLDSSFPHFLISSEPNAIIPPSIRERIEHELALIEELHYEAYFLTVDDIVRFARSQRILCQGRGAAANSAVCYCLGVTAVDPARIDLLVERFISRERNEPPDIDIDFEHERREEVIQYIYRKYGRDRAALVAEVISYRRRSAIRDVGKALGLSLDCVDRLAKSGDWWENDIIAQERLRELGFDPHDVTLRRAIKLAGELRGFPRHLSQHVGGFVISRGPLCEIVPIENAAMPERTVIEWDKDDIDEMGMLKVDCLGLGMLTCIRKALEFVNEKAIMQQGNKEIRVFDSHVCSEILHGKQATLQEAGQDFPGSDRMAEGDGARPDTLPGNDENAGGRAFWPDQSDATGGRIHSLEHCRREYSADAAGLSEIPSHGERIIGRIVDTSRAGNEYEDDGSRTIIDGASCGDRTCASVFDHESGRETKQGGKEIRNKGTKEPMEVPSLSLGSSIPYFLDSFYPIQFHTVPPDDPAVYDMLCKADSIGVFQVESRAQMTMLPRLKPRCYYDLVIEVAIVRPGPIQGGMVHPYLRRRNKEEKETYPNEKIRRVLGRTLGVPLFQEQAMRLVMVAAGFTAGEADQLRRAMAAWKRKGHLIERFTGKILSGMAANGYSRAFALQVVEQIKGFADYGFPESHAASFALLVYVSAWLKCHHPAAFAAALINSQPMGFYQPAQIVRDAKEHGVEVLEVDVNASGWDCRLEKEPRNKGNKETREPLDASFPYFLDSSSSALRLGMRLVAQMREEEAKAIAEAVRRQKGGRFATIKALWRASGVRVAAMRALARADAFRSMGLDRQAALWEVMKLRDEELPLFDGPEAGKEPRNKGTEELRGTEVSLGSSVPQCLSASGLPPISPSTQVVYDYAATGLSLKAHPVSFAREALARMGVTAAGELAEEKRWPHGKKTAVAGLVLVRQRPATAAGILFITLEDETGVANLVVRPAIYERYRKALRHSVALVAWGKVERQGQVVHLLVERAANLTELTGRGTRPSTPKMESASRDFH